MRELQERARHGEQVADHAPRGRAQPGTEDREGKGDAAAGENGAGVVFVKWDTMSLRRRSVADA